MHLNEIKRQQQSIILYNHECRKKTPHANSIIIFFKYVKTTNSSDYCQTVSTYRKIGKISRKVVHVLQKNENF